MSKPAILTIDDDPAVLGAVEADLRARYAERYRVIAADSGESALDVLRQLRLRDDVVALLLADQRMPGMDGTDFLEAAAELYPEAKRALLTAYADTEAAIRAINEAGVDYYLLKPWDPPDERLYPVLDDLLEEWRPPPLTANLRVLGVRWSQATHLLRDFLARNLVPYRWLDVERDEEAQTLLRVAGLDDAPLPVVVLEDGRAMSAPSAAELAEALGVRTHPERAVYDLVVVGAGPAGLAAAVYGASEGLSTLCAECAAPGGQAGLSARIENYLGFPAGLSGSDLAMRARQQAARFGAEILTPKEVAEIERVDPYRIVRFTDGGEVTTTAVVVTTGVSYRTLPVPGADRLAGAGLYYAAGRAEAIDHRDGAVFVVGGGNSAGQAAVFLATFAKQVTVLVRDPSLDTTMSRYLIDQLESIPNVDVRAETQVEEVQGDGHVERLRLKGPGEATEAVEADAVFVFIGMAPRTDWLEGVAARDPRGFVLTGPDLGERPPGWNAARAPMSLETSVPGVFAAGDVRAGSTKRVASAVGEGAVAVRYVHQHIATL